METSNEKMLDALDLIIIGIQNEIAAIQDSRSNPIQISGFELVPSPGGHAILSAAEVIDEYLPMGAMTQLTVGRQSISVEVLSNENGRLELRLLERLTEPIALAVELQVPRPSFLEPTLSYLTDLRQDMATGQAAKSAASVGLSILGPMYSSTFSNRNIEFVIGPPGSGKTYSLVDHVINRTKAGATVLVVAYSNPVTDSLFERITTHHKLAPKTSVVRYGLTRNALDVAAKSGKQYVQATKDLSDVESANILITTSHRMAFLAGLGIQKFDDVIIDEASSMPISLALVSSLHARSQVRVYGDPFQLGPVSMSSTESNELQSFHYGTSALDAPQVPEMLINGSTGTILRAQHRVPPQIYRVAFPPLYDQSRAGSEFELDSVTSPWGSGSLIYLDTSRTNAVEEKRGSSRGNNVNVAIVVEAVRSLLEQGFIDSDNPSIDLQVITPYRAQRAAIREALVKTEWISPDQAALMVSTIHQAQGREMDYVVIDTVAVLRPNDSTSTLGQLWDGVGWRSQGARLLNVALTRARKQALVILHRDSLAKPYDVEGHSTIALARLNGLLDTHATVSDVLL